MLLTRQLRLPIFLQDGMERTVEACAGKLDGETPERRIMKEMQEELGFKVSNVQRLFELYVSPAAIMEKIVFFTALFASQQVPRRRARRGEDIDVARPREELCEIAPEKSAMRSRCPRQYGRRSRCGRKLIVQRLAMPERRARSLQERFPR